MKVKWILITLAVVFLVSAGLTGCEKKKDITDTATVEQAAETPAPAPTTAEDPAAAKPKDHPAH